MYVCMYVCRYPLVLFLVAILGYKGPITIIINHYVVGFVWETIYLPERVGGRNQ